jgi:hypothetical protein
MTIKPHRGVEFSPGTRRKIIGLHKTDRKFDDIEKTMGIKLNTAEKIWRRRYNGQQSKAAPRNERPIKLNQADHKQLRDYVFFEIEILDHSLLPIYHSWLRSKGEMENASIGILKGLASATH